MTYKRVADGTNIYLKEKTMIIPNGYIRFKTELGTETDINVHVKISGNMCVWYSDETGDYRRFVPDFESLKKCDWFKELIKKYGRCQGIFQRVTKIEMPGEPKPNNKLNW
jgi:hypothetical protein